MGLIIKLKKVKARIWSDLCHHWYGIDRHNLKADLFSKDLETKIWNMCGAEIQIKLLQIKIGEKDDSSNANR